MLKTKTITTRKLLREFKSIKDDLREGRIDEVYVNIGDGEKIKIMVDEPKNNIDLMLERIYSTPPIKIKPQKKLFKGLEDRLIKRMNEGLSN